MIDKEMQLSLSIVFKCKKDFGGTYGLYTNDRVSSLFLNFRKSHIMSIQYIQIWCSKKVLDWCNHPQSIAKRKKTIILEDHRRLVQEGIQILNDINEDLNPERETFELLGGDPLTSQLKSFWWKTKCITCNDMYTLYPPKKNLEANLRNYIGGSRHIQKVLESTAAAKSVLISKKRRGQQSLRETARSLAKGNCIHSSGVHLMALR